MFVGEDAAARWSIADGMPIPIAPTLSSSSRDSIAASTSARSFALRVQRSRPLVPSDDLPVTRDDPGEDLRPSEVEPDGVLAVHCQSVP